MKDYALICFLVLMCILSSCSEDAESPTIPSIRILINEQEADTYQVQASDTLVIEGTLHYEYGEKQYIRTYIDDLPISNTLLSEEINPWTYEHKIYMPEDAEGTYQYLVEYIDQDEVVLQKSVDLIVP
ncbi:hypothetical protein OKW21_006758 [Catalinimonas alkaloidigena]|uniref:hypothetical protein n=1 Tax=Catalinimonas alkaloidigena TaxID=1075417 RepID=UPI0024065CB7|nr:hypothetical protein [Catalinimonas alkaloidigena]MDF9801269.1 hypothetical protein [Catalinimonas alkaloidigena]MDF9801449.1 hypothetical protein [Catalinimonas alkaloidigena]